MPTLIITNADPLVSLADAKIHLDILLDDTTNDSIITSLLFVATRKVENDTQRSLLQRDLMLVLDSFPCEREIFLEFPPIEEVTSINYKDENGDDQVLDPSNYSVALQTNQKARIRLKNGYSWPNTICEPESVWIEYSAGKATADLVEEDLRHAVLLLVALFFEKKLPVSESNNLEVPMNYNWLVGPHRVW